MFHPLLAVLDFLTAYAGGLFKGLKCLLIISMLNSECCSEKGGRLLNKLPLCSSGFVLCGSSGILGFRTVLYVGAGKKVAD